MKLTDHTMKRGIILWGCVVAMAAAVSCSDSKVCRCIYEDGGRDEFFEADEFEDCGAISSSANGVICREE